MDDTTGSHPGGGSSGVRPDPVDVRQQLAADRTLLAWIRTAITLAALGFVVARFELILREVPNASAGTGNDGRFLGLALVAAAALVVLMGMYQHRQVATLLAAHGEPLPGSRRPALAGAVLALLALIALWIYLVTAVK